MNKKKKHIQLYNCEHSLHTNCQLNKTPLVSHMETDSLEASGTKVAQV